MTYELYTLNCPSCTAAITVHAEGISKGTDLGDHYQVNSLLEEGLYSNLYIAKSLY